MPPSVPPSLPPSLPPSGQPSPPASSGAASGGQWDGAGPPVTDFGFYQRVLRRGWRVILAGLAVGLLLGTAWYAAAPRTYAATASVLVTATGADTTSTVGERTVSEAVNLDTEAQILTSADVVDRVLEATGDAFPARGILDHVAVQVPPNTNVLDITVSADDPRTAQEGAQAFAEAYLANRTEVAEESLATSTSEYEQRLEAAQAQQAELTVQLRAAEEAGDGETATGLRTRIQGVTAQIAALAQRLVETSSVVVTAGRVINAPERPSAPVSPDRQLVLGSAAALGLLLGVGSSMFTQRQRPRLSTADDVRRELRLPLLAEVLPGANGVMPPIATTETGQAIAFARLHRRISDLGARRVVLAPVSSEPAALHTAFNLAWQFARHGQPARLVLEDGDTPPDPATMDQSGGGTLELAPGEQDPVLPVARFVGEGLLATPAPLEVIDLAGRHEALPHLPGSDDVVTVLCVHRDSQLLTFLAQPGDAAVLVAEKDKDRAPDARDALQHLEGSGAQVAGVVLHPWYGAGIPRLVAPYGEAAPRSRTIAQSATQFAAAVVRRGRGRGGLPSRPALPPQRS